MRNNIAFDIDGTLVDFLSVLNRILNEKYGVGVLNNGKFKIETTPALSYKKITKVIDEAMRYISMIKPIKGAVPFLKKIHETTGQPILLITARDTRHAVFTNELIQRYFDVPYFLAMVDSYKDKLDYLGGIDYYVEDRRACANYLAGNGKKVLMPIRSYNYIESPNNIEYFGDFTSLIHRVTEFVK